MKKFFTALLFFLSLFSAFGQQAPAPNEPGSKEPPQADASDVHVISVPTGFLPGTSSGPSSTQAISLGSSMIAKEEGLNESNNTTATALPLGSTSVRLRGNIFPAGDVDFYSFTANAGDRVHAATMTAFGAGGTNSLLSLIGSDGTTVLEFDDNNGAFAGLSSSIAGAVIPATGTYYLKVNASSVISSIRPYDLYLKVQSGSPTPEVESNDTPATANNAPANGWISGSRDPALATEQDWFAINLVAGETVFLSLDLDPERDGVTWNGRLGFAQFGDAANQIVIADDAGAAETPTTIPSEAFFFTVKETGTYYLYVDSANPATGGPTATYTLSASKLDAVPGYTNYASADVPKAIGPGTGSVTSTITIPDTKRIKDLAVRITLDHALMQDVDAILTTPEGNQIALFTDIGSGSTGGQTQMDIRLSDYNAIPPSFAVVKNIGLMPEPDSKLDQLKGMKTNGTWTLTLYDDDDNASGGTLTAWSLDVLEDTTPATLVTTTTVYSQNFESGDGGFTHSGTADEWARGTPNTPATTTSPPVAAFTTANSGVNCWKTDLTGTYDASSDQLLESANIDLTGVTSNTITLSWAMKYQMESASFDNLDVYVEEVGGSGMKQTVFTWLGANQTVAPGNPSVNIGMASGWGTYFADISAFKGKTIRIKIRLRSDLTVNLGGVAIDDVTIYGACTALSVPLLAATNQTAVCTGSVASLSATCSVGTVNWYDAAGTGLLFTGSPFITPNLTANVVYNVRCADGPSCQSAFVQTTIAVDPQTVGGTITGSSTVCAGANSTVLNLAGNVGAVQKWQSSLTADYSSPTDIANITTSLTVSNVSQTTYYRAVVKSGACNIVNSGSASIAVNSSIMASISGALTVCPGQSSVLTASGGSGFLWSTGATSATISAPAGPYSVTVSSGSCSATASTTVTGVANPIATIVGTLTVSPGGSTPLTASGGTSFTWSTGETTASISATAGPYSVTVANSSGCTSTTSVTVTTVSPVIPPTAPFSITGVTTISCTPVANRVNVSFAPRYAGLNGQPIGFSVVNELSSTTSPGPYALGLYPDNPVITLKATQTGTAGEVSFVYNWLAACNGVTPPVNAAPTTTGIVNQSGTVSQGFSLNVASSFSDPNGDALTFTANGLPAGLSLSGSIISGTPSVSGVSTVTVRATDPGSLSVSTSFTITVSPASVVVPPTSPFSITGVTTVSCTTIGAGQRQIKFTPQYAGTNGQPITFRVQNELSPTTASGPYTLNSYTDNPSFTLKATQSGTASEASFSYNWLAACNGVAPPVNAAPTTTGIANQSGTVSQGFTLNVGASFSDPNGDILTFTATGLPTGLSLSGNTISGTPSVSGVSTVMVRATDPGSLSISTSFTLTVNPASVVVPPTSPFSITGVTTVSCTTISAGQRQIKFTPQYAGTNGQPITFRVQNELSPTTAPGPYTLNPYTDNPTFTLKATQSGTAGEASFSYNWLAACTGGARVGAEPVAKLSVRVLGNPAQSGQLSVEVTGTAGQPLRLTLTDLRGQTIDSHQVEQATSVERHSFPIGQQSAGTLLLRVSTPTQVQTVKVLKAE